MTNYSLIILKNYPFYLDKIPILTPDKNFGGQISPLRFKSLWIVSHLLKRGIHSVQIHTIKKFYTEELTYSSFLMVRDHLRNFKSWGSNLSLKIFVKEQNRYLLFYLFTTCFKNKNTLIIHWYQNLHNNNYKKIQVKCSNYVITNHTKINDSHPHLY